MQLSKIYSVALLVITLTFSPILCSPLRAGSIYLKGINSVAVEDDYDMHQYRGLMFNFSFGGPEYTRRRNSIQEDVLKKDEEINRVGGYVLLAVAAGIFIASEVSDN